MRIATLFGMGLLVASSAAMASGFEFQLGSHTAQLKGYVSPIDSLGYGGTELGFGGFVDSRKDFLGNLSLTVQGLAAGETPLTFGLGVSSYIGSVNSPAVDVAAIALGGLIKYTIPYRMPMSVVLKGYYAPGITSYNHSKNFSDVSLDYQIEVTPGATAYAGYRLLETNLKNFGTYKFDNGLHVGIRLHF